MFKDVADTSAFKKFQHFFRKLTLFEVLLGECFVVDHAGAKNVKAGCPE
jgi:hypothetical protein